MNPLKHFLRGYERSRYKDRPFTDPILPRYPNNPKYKIKWYPVDEILAKHAANDPGNIMNDNNLMGNRLSNAKMFIIERKYMTEDWPGGGIGGFQPTLINTKGRIMDGRHRLRALKELDYDPVPVEEYEDE